MANGLYYYKLQSNYSEDITKNCKLTINEIDSNFKTLKDEDIAKAEFDRESKTLILTRNDGDKLIVDLSDMTYDLQVNSDCDEDGQTIVISFDGKDGKEEVTFKNLVTLDMLSGHTMTHVIHDGTMTGDGTIKNPLGLNGTEKTGLLAPVEALIDLTKGEKLPDTIKLGTRYVTVEYVNDYGYLYNYSGVKKIADNLKNEGSAWRIPSKEDWDKLLDSLEECEYRNHTSTQCHVELGKLASKYLKSECGWVGEPDCECNNTEPMSCPPSKSFDDDDYTEDTSSAQFIPSCSIETTNGVDKYGMRVLPCGHASINTYNQPQPSGFKEESVFWTSTNVYNDTAQDYYTKNFYWNKSGVWQEAPCPDMYYSVRLVKDYDGTNDFASEYIDGVTYITRAFPDSKQVWTTANYSKKEGFIQYEQGGCTPEVTDVNSGLIREKRKVLFINEYNGKYWERRQLNEGDTVVIETPCSPTGETETKQICWEKDGCEVCVDVEIPIISQYNTEYRVFSTDECNQELLNTDDLVTERVLDTVIPLIYEEQEQRKKDYSALNRKIEQEMADRYNNDEIITKALNAETATRISADTELWEAIKEETIHRVSEDDVLSKRIDDEVSARTDADQVLEQGLNAERIARMLADKNLQEEIDAIIASGDSKHDEIIKMIEDETERATSKEKEIEESLNSEIERAKEKESALTESISAEVERATQAEADLQAKIDQEKTDRETADDALKASLDDEIKKREEADAEIKANLEEEIQARKDADDVLQANIDAESMNRQEADAEIYGKLPKAGDDVSFTISASAKKGEDNFTVPSYDASNTIHVVFDGNFGEI